MRNKIFTNILCLTFRECCFTLAKKMKGVSSVIMVTTDGMSPGTTLTLPTVQSPWCCINSPALFSLLPNSRHHCISLLSIFCTLKMCFVSDTQLVVCVFYMYSFIIDSSLLINLFDNFYMHINNSSWLLCLPHLFLHPTSATHHLSKIFPTVLTFCLVLCPGEFK